jgi:photosystem II stability/assembly factor-like uncharacterized protein
MKPVFKYLLLCTCLLFSQTLFSQVLMVENFEGSFPTPGWTFQALSGNNWSQSPSGNAVSGIKSLGCESVPFAAGNAWAFMPAFNLQPGNAYRLSYYYKGITNPFGSPVEKIKVSIGQGNNITAQVNTLHDYPNIVNTSFLQGIDTFTVAFAGSYNIAFRYYSAANQATGFLDSVVLQQVLPSPCISTPTIGTVSAPDMVAADSLFSLSLSGNYSLISGLSFQWQRRTYGNSVFQDISGAASSMVTATQTNSCDYRCVVRCENSGLSVVSNIVSVFVTGAGPYFSDKYVGDPNINKHIRGMSFLTPATGFVAFNSSVGFTQDTGQTYQQRPVTNANTNFNGYAVNLGSGFSGKGIHAFSIDSLLLYGDYGAEPSILFSANGGLTWKLVFHQAFTGDISNSLLDMKFPANYLGVAISQKFIMETSDRGQSWTVKYQVPAFRNSIFSKISIPSITGGYVAGGSYFYKRSLGAWAEKITAGLPGNIGLQFNQVSFVSETVGYLVKDDDFTIYKTVDGGANWTVMNDPLVSGIAAADIHFLNDSTGLAATPYSYNVVKTSNSGRTWELCKRSSNYQYANYGMNRLYFLNNSMGWAGGRGEFLMFTSTAGNPTLPKAFFAIDTMTLSTNGLVQLQTGSYPYYQHKWFRNGILIGNSNTGLSFTHSPYESTDTLILVVSNGIDNDTLTRYQEYNFVLPPEITSYSPTAAAPGSSISITGFGFLNTSKVSFGGMTASSFLVISPTHITAVVGGGLSGNISITTPLGSGGAAGFTLILPAAPIISGVQPLAANLGSVVTITGANFAGNVTETVVYFGKVKATVLTASSTEITCKVPAGAGYERISVINKSSRLSALSPDYFAVTVPGSGTLTQQSFYKVLNLPTDLAVANDIYPIKVTAGDLDGDGRNDLLAAVRYNLVNDSLYIYRNLSLAGTINFSNRIPIGIGTSPVIADLNGDDKPDISFIDRYATLCILINQSTAGNFVFSPLMSIPMSSGPRRVAVGDVNSDGRPDLVISGYSNRSLGILLNVGFGTTTAFAPVQEFAVIGTPMNLAVGDVNADGKADVVVACRNLNTCYVSVLQSQAGPALGFLPAINLEVLCGTDAATHGSTSDIFIVDFNNDGKRDIIINNVLPNYTPVSMFRNNSVGAELSFAPRQDYLQANNVSTCGTMSNFRGLALPDFVSSGYYFPTFNFFANTSAPSALNVANTNFYGSNGDLWSIAASDFDGDGKQDVVVATAFGDPSGNRGFHIYRNRMDEVTIPFFNCSGAGPVAIIADLSGSVYQWQVDTGAGFVNIANGTFYSNVNTSNLSILSTPGEWSGYKYRCKVNGSNSLVFSLRLRNTWMGTIDSMWENPANWSCGHVPVVYEEVMIQAGNVVIHSDVAIGSLVAGSGVNLSVEAGFNLTILH